VRTLVIDTATKACSVALFDGADLVAANHEVIGRGHAERLLPFISDLPDRGRADRVMVNVGPGSFTGIRVGVAAARALGFAWKAHAAGYGCLRLVAAMAAEQIGGREDIDVVMTGGHGEYFFQHFSETGKPAAEAVSASPEQLDTLRTANVIAGDIDGINGTQHLRLLPDARKWHLIADIPALPPSPIYGRAPDAKLPKARA
jgi:tRNA threonylcarbamoyladenosine biosynthesis protein TsaB